jgi:hypothetical protein
MVSAMPAALLSALTCLTAADTAATVGAGLALACATRTGWAGLQPPLLVNATFLPREDPADGARHCGRASWWDIGTEELVEHQVGLASSREGKLE